MIDHCEEFDLPCFNTEYFHFDNIASSELMNPPTVDEIINQSDFCTLLHLDSLEYADGIWISPLNDYLKRLKDKTGLYHIWVHSELCSTHEINSLLGIYVGKGIVWDRIKDHIKKMKWPKDTIVWITFFECENRISKYLEQLFLDTYSFHTNTQENTGTIPIFARWPEERTWVGTEFDAVVGVRSDRITKKGIKEF